MRIRTEASIHNSISSDQTYCCERMAKMVEENIIDFRINSSTTTYPLQVRASMKIRLWDLRRADDRDEHLEINNCPFCGEKIE